MDGEQCRDWVDWLASDMLALTFSLDDSSVYIILGNERVEGGSVGAGLIG